jgi:nitroreductase
MQSELDNCLFVIYTKKQFYNLFKRVKMKEIFERRSIRKYTEQEVSAESVKELLKAAMAAPSAGNQQTWDFIVVRNRMLLNEIPKFHPNAQMLVDAPAAIIVCGVPEREKKYTGYWVQDCAAAVENILIEAQFLGLGAVWLGIYPNEDRIERLRELFGIPESIVPFAVISIGYPAGIKEASQRYDEGKIHFDKW